MSVLQHTMMFNGLMEEACIEKEHWMCVDKQREENCTIHVPVVFFSFFFSMKKKNKIRNRPRLEHAIRNVLDVLGIKKFIAVLGNDFFGEFVKSLIVVRYLQNEIFFLKSSQHLAYF